ncbi:MAG: hypothetical protein KIS77_20475 [Saprospiraceae bacterium]|nr:hypothetical protein [Saprospiraceae bacterium]
MQKKNLYIALAVVCLLACLSIWLGCQKELNGNNGSSGVLNRTDCVLFMSFEVETTTAARTVVPSDFAQLEPIDQIMALPHRERFAVEVCYKSSGQKDLSMTRLTPTEPINYPKNTADGYLAPDYSRLIVVNGVATYYDQFNNVMRSGSHSPDADAVIHILDMVANRKPLTDAEFNQGLQIMRDSGLAIQEHQNNLVTIRYNYPDGSYSVQALDKSTRAAVGNLHYGPNGKLQTRSMLDVEGTAQNPIVRRAYMESFITSMVGDIPMKVEQYSKFDNFTLTFNQ